jgi:hypothetical protein
MEEPTLESVYTRFAAIWANGRPIRGDEELLAAMQADERDPDRVDEAWLRSLDPRWVHFDSEAPFKDEHANRVYRRLSSA